MKPACLEKKMEVGYEYREIEVGRERGKKKERERKVTNIFAYIET